ncbi:ATP-dependent nuclease [Amycolatopsis magusensis]|uniref:ATP-dependent nuclease n=1 Tax=Amycolatopsis magusensis TaxID=882444 RepID=UPI0024A9D9E8|nr:AAA family ATPase [Amycolatopsis magusensis]MDI5979268.1 AAA family ATPase [Amycolatopsis magusensis]
MRRSNVQRDYETLSSANHPYPLRAVTIDGHVHLGTVTTLLESGVTVFCGVNGVGKTQFLKTLSAHLDGSDIGDATVETEVDAIAKTVKCVHVDTGWECFDTVNQVSRTPSLDEKRAASDQPPEDKQTAALLGFILNRDYDSASAQELDRDDTDSTGTSTWYHYEVTYRGATYGPREMSLGELAASIVLRALRTARYGSVLLLDEPENFLSPQARRRLLDVIVSHAVNRKLSVVIASHSIEMAHRLPTTSLRTIERDPQGTGVAIDTMTFPSQVARAIGIEQRPDVLLLVEDAFARLLLKAILARQLPAWRMALGIVESGRKHGSVGGGDGAVVQAAKALSDNDIGIRVLGVLDGDARQQIALRDKPYLAFLPGLAGPESVVLDAVMASPSAAAAALDVPEEAIAKGLRAVEGVDSHDRPATLCRAVGIEVTEIVGYAARWFATSPHHVHHVQELMEKINAMLHLDHGESTEVGVH